MTDIGYNPYRTQLGRPVRWLTGYWRDSRTCFMLSVLASLALPIPCDAYLICVPPQVGDSWTYHRTVDIKSYPDTRLETVTVSVVGIEQVGDQEYYQVYSTDTNVYSGDRRSEDVALYRASADGAIWRYDAKSGREGLYFDLWHVGADQEGEIRYEGVFFGLSTEADEPDWGPMELARRGPLEIVVGDSLYSGVFAFWIELECCPEFYGTLYVHPEIGAVKETTYTMEFSDVWELISFSRQSNVPSVVREVTWGTVKRRHMFERPR